MAIGFTQQESNQYFANTANKFNNIFGFPTGVTKTPTTTTTKQSYNFNIDDKAEQRATDRFNKLNFNMDDRADERTAANKAKAATTTISPVKSASPSQSSAGNAYSDALHKDLNQYKRSGGGGSGIIENEGSGNISQYTNRLFGAPFQLLDSVDKRFDNINPNLGNEYLRNIMLNSPILYIRPGMPYYTGDQSDTTVSNMVKNIYGSISAGLSGVASVIRDTLISGAKVPRMFGFRETYYEYTSCVNLMCRSLAEYLNILDGDQFPNGCYTSGGQWEDFKNINWGNYRMNSGTTANAPISDIGKTLWAFVSTNSSLAGNAASKTTSVEFMVDPVEFRESLSNRTKESMIESSIDAIRGVGTEIAWITQSTNDPSVLDELKSFLGNSTGDASMNIKNLVQNTGGSFLGNLAGGAIASLKGQKMIYPKIYDSSSSEMNYRFSVTLTTPYGDPYNYYMNILVPLCHLIALAAPRMVTSNTVASPFLVQAYMPGMCTCQLGIVNNMTITKNPTTNHVSVNGFPLTIKVEFDVEELYNALAISPADDPPSFWYNETLADYLCNLAGLAPGVDTYLRKRQVNSQMESKYWNAELWRGAANAINRGVIEPILVNPFLPKNVQ